MKILRLPLRGLQRRGAALVTVLACLVFISILTVAFLVSMRTRLQISKAGSNTSLVQILADTAVNISISQLHDATKLAGENHYAWASQPGMIRLYGDTGAKGYYKLYSWDNMVGTAAYDPGATSEAPPENWADTPGVYTDLNKPVTDDKGKVVFPILDYTEAVKFVQGISVASAPGGTTARPAPMPVKWLYVLADGSIYPPSATSSGTKAVIAEATTTNPIVGRFAFWTDDDTCKVNINTASYAKNSSNINTTSPFAAQDYNTFWDTPRFSSPAELNMASYQPAQGEYQRYPGHPATVALNMVFPDTVATPAQLFDIAPRYAYSGSKGATARYDVASWIDRATLGDRLYASVDELIFDPVRIKQGALDQSKMEAAQFFLTANSRAPELNLFGLPRVSMWPIDRNHVAAASPRVSAADRLLAFCSTIAGQKFFFTRSNPKSSTADIGPSNPRNSVLLNYLDALAAQNIPGFGGKFSTKYGTQGVRQILTEIFDYIRITNPQDSTLAGYVAAGAPVHGGNNPNWYAPFIAPGYDLGKGQVMPTNHPDWKTQGFGRIGRPVELSVQFIALGESFSLPTPATDNVPVPNEMITEPADPSKFTRETATITLKPDPSDPSKQRWYPPEGSRAMMAVFYVSLMSPTNGVMENSYYQWIEIKGLDKWSVNGKSLGFPATAAYLFPGSNNGQIAMDKGNSYMPFVQMLAEEDSRTFNKSGSNAKNNFPFYGAIISVPVSTASPTMDFTTEPITVNLYDVSDNPRVTPPLEKPPTSEMTKNNLVQTLEVRFPNAPTMPVPGLTKYPLLGTGGSVAAPILDAKGRVTNVDRFRMPAGGDTTKGIATAFNGEYILDRDGIGGVGDVFQSMVLSPAFSDARMLALQSVPSTAFVPHPNYGISRIAHNIFFGNGVSLVGNAGPYGKLVAGANYSHNPMIPPSVNGATDWDNGVATAPDGPYINAPDSGNANPTGAAASFVPYFTDANGIYIVGSSFFSPNRQVSSPGMFGSLSTGIDPVNPVPWRTLLFRPPQSTSHLGYTSPRDHLLMDLFWMPITEPYAISEPFSTAGKVNLNQQLLPFKYIKRNTALRAALAGEKIAIMRKADAPAYKLNSTTSNLNTPSRLPLDLDETLKQFDAKFAAGEIYRSATEICDLYLVPQGYTWPTFQTSWYGDDFALVGDNVREKPYANIYEKITTKSNTYTVHYQAQVLQQTASLKTDPTVFDTAKNDRIQSEQRGSVSFERYLDPKDPDISTNINATSPSLEGLYRSRINSSKVFNP